MNDMEVEDQSKDLVLEYDIDAPPEKVWRAISIPAFRETWLPNEALADADPVAAAPGEEIRYRVRDDKPPFRESVVTFCVSPNARGGTRLRIVHGLVHSTPAQLMSSAANSNRPRLVRAA